MKISVDENRAILLEEVFSGVMLKTRDGEKMGICMRDSGFEFTYEGKHYSAQKGVIKQLQLSPRGNVMVEITEPENIGTNVGPVSVE